MPSAHAYILQNADKRIVFVIPYPASSYSLIGTTDVPVVDVRRTRVISADEIDYLCSTREHLSRAAAQRRPTSSGPTAACGRSTTTARQTRRRSRATTCSSSTRPDGRRAAAVDLRRQDHDLPQACRACARRSLRRFFRRCKPRGPIAQPLPGGDLPPGGLDAVRRERSPRGIRDCQRPCLRRWLAGTARARHASWATTREPADLGADFGQRLYAAEIDYLVAQEWAIARPTTYCGGEPNAAFDLRGEERDAVAAYLRQPSHSRRVGVSAAMRPLVAMPLATRAAMRGVLTDIDDTLSTHGRLTAQAYAAMERLRAAGLLRDPDHRPTGRLVRSHRADVAGRCGGRRERRVLHAPRRRARRLARRFVATKPTRRAIARDSSTIAERYPARGARRRAGVGPAVPRNAISRSISAKTCRALPRDAIDRIVALMERGGHDRQGELDPRQRLVRHVRQAGDDANACSPRHSASTSMPSATASSSSAIRRTTRRCSSIFPNSVGVANVRAFADRIATSPAYVTERESGAGFAELAAHLLAAR